MSKNTPDFRSDSAKVRKPGTSDSNNFSSILRAASRIAGSATRLLAPMARRKTLPAESAKLDNANGVNASGTANDVKASGSANDVKASGTANDVKASDAKRAALLSKISGVDRDSLAALPVEALEALVELQRSDQKYSELAAGISAQLRSSFPDSRGSSDSAMISR